jgi:hypothetical protein
MPDHLVLLGLGSWHQLTDPLCFNSKNLCVGEQVVGTWHSSDRTAPVTCQAIWCM